MACTIHSSKYFSTRVGGKQKSHSCAREADPALLAPHESPRPSQHVAIDLQFERQDEEVNRRGASVHLLLVATKFSVVVALQGVATTYHDALKFTQSTALLRSRRHVHQHDC